jgi:hypothetical protein
MSEQLDYIQSLEQSEAVPANPSADENYTSNSFYNNMRKFGATGLAIATGIGGGLAVEQASETPAYAAATVQNKACTDSPLPFPNEGLFADVLRMRSQAIASHPPSWEFQGPCTTPDDITPMLHKAAQQAGVVNVGGVTISGPRVRHNKLTGRGKITVSAQEEGRRYSIITSEFNAPPDLNVPIDNLLSVDGDTLTTPMIRVQLERRVKGSSKLRRVGRPIIRRFISNAPEEEVVSPGQADPTDPDKDVSFKFNLRKMHIPAKRYRRLLKSGLYADIARGCIPNVLYDPQGDTCNKVLGKAYKIRNGKKPVTYDNFGNYGNKVRITDHNLRANEFTQKTTLK